MNSDRYPLCPASYVLALKSFRLGDDFVRSIINKCTSVPGDGKEMLEILRKFAPLKAVGTYEDTQAFETAKADGYWLVSVCAGDGIHVISCLEERYPNALKELTDYPLVLYAMGDPGILTIEKKIAIVGTREPSEYGKKVANRLGEYFAERGWITVSGFAPGCDTQAHNGCISANMPTIAVLAHGMYMIDTPEDRSLANAIIKNGGCLVSEYSFYTKPGEEQSIARDRIQAALSKAVIVVESEMDGGAMHTARFALKLNRKLVCMGYDREVPDAKMGGNDYLVKEGKADRLVDAKDMDEFINEFRGVTVGDIK